MIDDNFLNPVTHYLKLKDRAKDRTFVMNLIPKEPLRKDLFEDLRDMDMRKTVFRDTPRPWKVQQTSQLIAEATNGHVIYTGDGFRIVDADGKGICSFHNQTATNLARAQAIVNCINEWVERG